MARCKEILNKKVPAVFQESSKPKTCFVILSSKEKHTNIVYEYIESALSDTDLKVTKLDVELKSDDSQYEKLLEDLKACSLAIVILDGLRPNVVLEYGIVRGMGKPCLVLKDENAIVDVIDYYPDEARPEIKNPKLDINNHLSDVKDRYYKTYNWGNPEEARKLIKAEYIKLKTDIDQEFLRCMIPGMDSLMVDLAKLYSFYEKKEKLTKEEELEFRVTVKKIEDATDGLNVLAIVPFYFIVGSILMKQERFSESLAIADKALGQLNQDIKGQNVNVLLLKIDALAELKRYQKALEATDFGLQSETDVEPLWHRKGHILDVLDRKDDASLCYKKGAQLGGQCSQIYVEYGLVLMEKEDYNGALDEFEKSLKINPKKIKPLILKAVALMNLKNAKDAKVILEDALSREPDNIIAMHAMAELLAEHEKNFDDALKLIENILKKEPDNIHALFLKAGILSDMYDFEEAYKIYEKMLRIKPGSLDIICSKGSTLSNQGKREKALEIFTGMKEKCSTYSKCQNIKRSMAITYIALGKNPEALPLIDSLLEDKWAISDLSMKVQVLYNLGRREEANPFGYFALELVPSNEEEWYDRASILIKFGKKDDAINALRKAVAINPYIKKQIRNDTEFDTLRTDIKFRAEFGG